MRGETMSNVSDERGLQKVVELSDIRQAHVVRHFLYVPDQSAASAIAQELGQRGFATTGYLSGGEQNWLVLATHQMAPTLRALSATRRLMESLVADFGGKYDGWEVEIRRH
jgi:hypothetical protein